MVKGRNLFCRIMMAGLFVLGVYGRAETVDALGKVLIIGDSISIGYTPFVQEFLEGGAVVRHNPGNAQDTAWGVEKLDEWLGDGDWDVIHFNWGLWDMRFDNGFDSPPRVPLAEYEKNLTALVKRLDATGAKLIWATTTPVPAGARRRIKAGEIAYNDAARRIVNEHNIAINDLHSLVAPKADAWQKKANVHFTRAGSQAMGRQVADCIVSVLTLRRHVNSDGLADIATGLEEGDIVDILEPIRKEYKLPALAAAVVSKGKVIGLGAVGERKYKSGVSVTTNDRFHLGSCTKAMTATMIGILVERGKLRWDMTLAEALPGLAMNDGYRAVTIRHLLAHRAGLPNASWPRGKTFMDMHKLPGRPRQQRLAYAKLILNQKPQAKPGEKYTYSNAGFAIVGVIAEEATDTAWEELMKTMLFEPLGMETAGFGAMGTQGKIDEPWQHKRGLFGRKKAIAPGRYSDNPPVIAPGGIVHCSMGDWAKFIILHLEKGSFAGRQLIKAETLKELRKPHFGGNYAGGWLAVDRSWGGGGVFTHSGSNNQNYAVVWMAPLKRYAVLVATNQGGGSEAKALDKAAAALIRKFKP